MFNIYNDTINFEFYVAGLAQAEPALMFDSVMALAHGLAALDRGTALKLANLSCDSEKPWNDGSSLFNYINSVRPADSQQ